MPLPWIGGVGETESFTYGTTWSDDELDVIVADYFTMLADDLVGRPYSKAEHNRLLQQEIDRTRGSIEYKHQNISAVLKGLGEVWIDGYKPAVNYQASLEDAVLRWLHRHPGGPAIVAQTQPGRAQANLRDAPPLWIGPPPTHSNAPPPVELEQMTAIARKYDVAGRDARNRILGRAGEELIFDHERFSLTDAGRPDLSKQVRWVSDIDGDGAGYDIRSFESDGRDRLIEVKTTNGWERTPFFLSRNELAVSESSPREWCLVRLWNFARKPKAFELRPPLEAHVSLIATAYQADLL